MGPGWKGFESIRLYWILDLMMIYKRSKYILKIKIIFGYLFYKEKWHHTLKTLYNNNIVVLPLNYNYDKNTLLPFFLRILAVFFVLQMAYLQVFEFTAVVRGFHYYRKIWNPKPRQILNCYHETDNAFDLFAIKVCEMDSENPFGHLPMEISRATKFFIDRGATVAVELTSEHYRRSPLVQGGIVDCVQSDNKNPWNSI